MAPLSLRIGTKSVGTVPDFGPNSAEVAEFLKRLGRFTWDDWGALQRFYVASLVETEITQAQQRLASAAEKAGLSQQVRAAGMAASEKFPSDRPQRPPSIISDACRKAATTGGQAVAGRRLVGERDFELMFMPFTRMTGRVAGRQAGCGASAAILVLAMELIAWISAAHFV
jgi:hypothetical protein